MNNYPALRNRAMAWLKSKRNFAEGIAILKEAGFRPQVVRVLERNGSANNGAKERLEYNIRDFLKVWCHAELGKDTDLVLGVVDGKEVATATPVKAVVNSSTEPKLMSKEMGERVESGVYPTPVASLIKLFRQAYVSRDRLFRELQSIPEDNSDEHVERRKQISDEMQRLSDEMDKIYPSYLAYVERGELPAEPMADAHAEKTRRVSREDDLARLDTLDKKGLLRLKKSLSTKISRAENLLDYQQEAKGEALNPLPDGPKRIKYESKIKRLRAELDKVVIAIAKLG